MEPLPKDPWSPSPGGFFKRLEETLVSLKKATRDLAFYPPTHPALKQSLERTVMQLESLLEQTPSFTLTVTKEGFSYDGEKVGEGNPQLRAFALDLYFRKVQALQVLRTPSPEEVEQFLRLILVDPKRLLEKGGLKQALSDQGVKHVRIEELTFRFHGEDGLRGKGVKAEEGWRASEQEGGLETLSSPPGGPGEPPFQETGQPLQETSLEDVLELGYGFEASSTVTPPLPLRPEEPEDVERLLERLEATEEPGEYQYLAGRLETFAEKAKEARDLPTFLKILSSFALHIHPLHPKSSGCKGLAEEAIGRMADEKGIGFLIDELCFKDTPHDELLYLLATLGTRAVSPLLERLKKEEDRSARRRLITALIRQGKDAVPLLLKALEDPRWYVVRNVALILGELRAEEAVDLLAGPLKHEDHRVRREVVRALSRIGGQKVSAPLLEALHDQDPVVCQSSIAALGTLKETRAIPALIEIASKPKDLDLQKAAIAALGQLGGAQAFRLLSTLLRRPGWLRSHTQEELRVAAAAALGRMRTAEAFEVLKAAAEAFRGRVRQACLQALVQHFGQAP